MTADRTSLVPTARPPRRPAMLAQRNLWCAVSEVQLQDDVTVPRDGGPHRREDLRYVVRVHPARQEEPLRAAAQHVPAIELEFLDLHDRRERIPLDPQQAGG